MVFRQTSAHRATPFLHNSWRLIKYLLISEPGGGAQPPLDFVEMYREGSACILAEKYCHLTDRESQAPLHLFPVQTARLNLVRLRNNFVRAPHMY